MCQDGIYFSFYSTEDSILSDHEEDSVNPGALANTSTIVEADVSCAHSELISAEETSV